MVGSLVFVLTLLGFVLLMIAERAGLSASIGLAGMYALLALALLARGLGSVTSRFPRFAEGASAESGGPGSLTLVARCACVLVALAVFSPSGVELRALAPGFVAGFVLAHLSWRWLSEPVLAARLARLLLGLALALLAFVLLRPALEQLSMALLQGSLKTRWVFGVLALVVLLPGGLLAVSRVQRMVLALVLVVALVPVAALMIMAAMERGDPLAIEMLGSILPLAQQSFGRFHPAPSGLLIGVVGGLAARGSGVVSHKAAGIGLAGALLVCAVLVLLHLASAEWLARIVGQRIAGVAPAAWPVFVFEPELAGWLRSCGVLPADPLAVARACKLTGAQSVPRPSDITFLAPLSLPALAVSNRLPVMLGELWTLMPLLVGSVGLLSVLHGAALAVSESFLFGMLNPSGLQSFRLAMARLSLLALVLMLLAQDPLPGLLVHVLTGVLATLLGVSALLIVLSRIKRPQLQADTP